MTAAEFMGAGSVEKVPTVGMPPAPPTSSSLMKTVFRNSAWSTGAVIAAPILQFLFGGLTLRYVGVESTGFSLAVGAILGIAGRFGTCGVGEAALPAIASSLAAGDERRVRRLTGVVLAVFCVSSAAAAALMLACAGPFVLWSKTPIAASTALTFIAISCVSHFLGQMSLALTTILRAAGRYDLVTASTTPLAIISGIAACILVPVFPSLTTIALLGLASASCGAFVAFLMTSRAVPSVRRPLLGLTELPALARYGFWLLLTHVFGALMGGVDDLVITGTCGAAAVPPWAIGKRLWLTAHTFLAQHTEHLIPTLGALRNDSRDAFRSVAMAMHWYVVLLAATGYTLIAWWGEVIVAVVAGTPVAVSSQPAVFSYSLLGIGYALLIMPVVTALAEGASRPAFVVAMLSNSVLIATVFCLARTMGAPAVYYAPVAAIPALLMAAGSTSTNIFDPTSAWARIRPVLIPLVGGVLGTLASLTVPIGIPAWKRMALGAVLATCVFLGTIGLEWVLSINTAFHRQLMAVVRHAFALVANLVARANPFEQNRVPKRPEQVRP